jgi:hypothetical protein
MQSGREMSTSWRNIPQVLLSPFFTLAVLKFRTHYTAAIATSAHVTSGQLLNQLKKMTLLGVTATRHKIQVLVESGQPINMAICMRFCMLHALGPIHPLPSSAQSILVSGAHYLIIFHCQTAAGFLRGAPSLTRGRSTIYNCCLTSSAVILVSESRTPRGHI